jgi:hypothetical protein
MSGRPVHLLAAAVAAASFFSISPASAGCYSGCGYSYAAPVVTYSAPVVYSVSYSAPVTYGAPCASPCGYASYSYAYPARPMYVVNQGPTFTEPVVGEPDGVYNYGWRRSYPNYSDGLRWRSRSWGYRGYGSRGFRYGYRGHGYRSGFGYRHHGYRHGGRYSMRHPMVGPGGIYRGPRHMNRMHPRHAAPRGRNLLPSHTRPDPRPGSVQPMNGGKKMP